MTGTVEWGRGDLFTLLIALLFFALGCLLHRRALRQRGTESTEMLIGIMSNSLTVGPLLMIILDPLNKSLGIFRIDLLAIVINESRITLWFACFLALINTLMSLCRSRETVPVQGSGHSTN